MTLVKDGDGLWTQLENVEDYAGLGSQAYRKIGMGGPQRTITFFAASKMEDYWEPRLLGTGSRGSCSPTA